MGEIIYVQYANGTIGKLMPGDGIDLEIPEGATVISGSEYEAQLSALREAHEIYQQELRDAELAALKTDYDELRAAGIPDATARRLSGYTGP